MLVNDCLDIFIEKLQNEAKSNDYNMIVTPKEIDDLIENMKDVVARGINFAV